MGGKETVRKLIENDPHVNAIAPSGYSSDLVMGDFANILDIDVSWVTGDVRKGLLPWHARSW